MVKTAVIYSPKYLEHNPGRDHPETANRLRVILRELNRSGILQGEKCSILEPKAATVEDLELVHEPDYVRLVERCCAAGGGILDLGDTVVSRESYEVTCLAVGGAILGADLVMAGEAENAFALVRPPGHHAGSYYGFGFCVFNNVAVAAAHLLHRLGLDRVLILDIDAHHGNGTQEIFYNTKKVLYMSLHQDPTLFPGAGFADEVGEGEGLGYTVNIPFPLHVDDRIYLTAMDEIVVPIIRQYKPQFILLSAGFDGHYTDPVAQLSLSAFSYLQTFGKVLDLASRICGRRVVAVLEGGYRLKFLAKMATAAVAKMAGIPYEFRDKRSLATPGVRKQAERVIRDVRSIQSSFWSL
ncbi:MAG: histone deacetylase [Candidatus Bathyarchaeia archaeon]